MSITTLHDANEAHFNKYVEYAIDNLAREFTRCFALAPSAAEMMASKAVRSVLPKDFGAMGEKVFLCEVRNHGRTVGTALFGLHPVSGEPRYFIWDLLIDKEHRGCGFGRGTMLAIEEHARQHGVVAIELSVFAGNDVAMPLYQSLGYQVASTTMLKSL